MTQIDNDKDLEELFPCISCGINADTADGFGTCTCGNEKLRESVDQYTQSKLKAFAGEVEKAIENNQFDSLHVASEKEKIVYSEKPRKDIDLEKFALALKAIKGKAGIE